LKILNKTLSCLLIGMCLLFTLSVQAYADDMRTFKILVLNSYHKGFQWVDGIVEAVESGLNAQDFNYDLRVEYMDTKATKYNTALKAKLYELYSLKYDNYKFDVIVVSDDHAFDFIREYHKELFPDTPIVFCAVNNSNAASLIDKKYFTGVLETPAQESMVNLALKLHPGIKKIYLIADTTPSGNYRWEKQTVPLISVFPDIEFIRIDDSLSFSEIEDKMINLPDDSITFYAVLTRDKTGRYFPLKEAVSRISKASRRPIYTFLSQDLKYGLIGGNVLDGYHQGEKAIDIVIRILQGESISDIPIEKKPTSQFMFNYPQLIRYNIRLSDLPEKSIILNKPYSFYEDYKRYVWAVGSVVFIIIILIFYVHKIKRRLLEEALRKSEGRLVEAQKIAQIGHFIFDTRTDTWMSSHQLNDIFGIDKNLRKNAASWVQIIHPDHRETMSTYLQKNILTQHQIFDKEYKIINKRTGQDKWVHGLGKLKFDKNNNPVELFGTIQDITEHKLMEVAVQKSKQRLDGILYGTNAGTWEWNVQTGETSFNERWANIIGYTLHELEPISIQTWIDLAHPDDLKVSNELLEKHFKQEVGYYELECRIKHKNGNWVWVLDRGRVISWTDDNKPLMISGTHQDVTLRKRAEEARDKLQVQLIQFEKSESLSRMAGAIAHHFNNQLAVVIGYIELALVDAPQDAALIEDLTSAMQGAHKAAEVSGLMLTYLGQTTGRYIPMDLSETCRQSVSSLQASAPREIALNVELRTSGPVIRGNANQIQQVLGNLITNAWEAMDKQQGGIDVIVRTLPRADIPLMLYFPPDWKPKSETYACLEIRDTGCGIEEKDIHKVFDPFFTSKFTGRGLGLAIVLGIVKAHGGAVTVDSEKGAGSSFKVYLAVTSESVVLKPDEKICASAQQ